MKTFLSNQQIENILKIHYDIDAIKILALDKGADANACVFKIDAQNQSSYFVKVKQSHHDEINLAIIELLVQAGIQSIISPVKTNQKQSMVSIEEFYFIVYPFIEAEDGFSRLFSDKQWMLFGKTLRQIHDLEVPESIQARLRKETYSDQFRQVVRSFYENGNFFPIADEIADKLFAFMQQEKKVILNLVDRAESLAQKIQNTNSKYVLCHSDIHAGNVLINGNESFYIIDWDAPMMAPKERDLMFIGGGVGTVWNQSQEEILFYQGYGSALIDKNILAYYRHERIAEDIAEYIQLLILSAAGGENRKVMYQHFIDMFASKGVVEMALSTSLIK